MHTMADEDGNFWEFKQSLKSIDKQDYVAKGTLIWSEETEEALRLGTSRQIFVLKGPFVLASDWTPGHFGMADTQGVLPNWDCYPKLLDTDSGTIVVATSASFLYTCYFIAKKGNEDV
tara:strand:+ start:65 stop:418 length:354 start_codon:yes stop_codon:yes gene_type:complete